MICQICNRDLKSYGMPAHLKRTHNISCEDYYIKYYDSNNKCLECGNETSFINLTNGFRKFCCQNCARRHTIKTTREKYGVSNISQVKEINSKMRSSIKENWNNLTPEQYNNRCDAISNGTKLAMKEAINKINNEVDLYCKENNFIRATELIKQYGSGFFQSDIVKIDYVTYKHKLLVPIKQIDLIKQYNEPVRSKHESYLYNVVKLLYPNALQNTRKVINGKELDIFIPELNTAIEYNGIYYHSIEHDSNMYDFHLNKSLICKQHNIRLIHIYQFENFDTQILLLLDYLQGNDNYPKNDFNKNNLIDEIPKPEIIYKDKYTIYGAGKLY